MTGGSAQQRPSPTDAHREVVHVVENLVGAEVEVREVADPFPEARPQTPSESLIELLGARGIVTACPVAGDIVEVRFPDGRIAGFRRRQLAVLRPASAR